MINTNVKVTQKVTVICVTMSLDLSKFKVMTVLWQL